MTWRHHVNISINDAHPRCITVTSYERDSVSNRRRLDCLLNRVFRRRSKETSKLRVTGFCEGNSPVTGEFPAQRASNAENVSILWRHYGMVVFQMSCNGDHDLMEIN